MAIALKSIDDWRQTRAKHAACERRGPAQGGDGGGGVGVCSGVCDGGGGGAGKASAGALASVADFGASAGGTGRDATCAPPRGFSIRATLSSSKYTEICCSSTLRARPYR